MSSTSPTRPWVMAYQNFDDDEAYVPVEEEPDLADVAQRYANETGLIVVREDRRTAKLQDCECVPTSEQCAEDGKPCHVRENVDCWVLSTFENSDAGRRDLARWQEDADDKRAWEPKGRWSR